MNTGFRRLREYLFSKGFDYKNGNVFWNVAFLPPDKFKEFHDMCLNSWDELLKDEDFYKVFRKLQFAGRRKKRRVQK